MFFFKYIYTDNLLTMIVWASIWWLSEENQASRPHTSLQHRFTQPTLVASSSPWLDQSEVELYGSSQSQAGLKELSGLRIVSAFQFLKAGRLILRLQVEF